MFFVALHFTIRQIQIIEKMSSLLLKQKSASDESDTLLSSI